MTSKTKSGEAHFGAFAESSIGIGIHEKSDDPIHIIDGGLAGSEAAWRAANSGVPVHLYKMRPVRGTDAHKNDGLAELVCSNSFRSDD